MYIGKKYAMMCQKDVNKMIDFHRVSLADREEYSRILAEAPPRGCEYSFANLFLWGRQHIALRHGCAALFSHFYGRSVYPFPIGDGDKAAVIREILSDAKKRGLPCRITGMTDADRAFLEETFPDTFHFRTDRDSYDYVYQTDALADLRGRKYQKKRNHFNRFQLQHPGYEVLPLTAELLPAAKEMVDQWYETRAVTDPEGDYLLERRAIGLAFANFEALQLEGLVLVEEGKILAVTMGSRMREESFDIHFEKALEDVDGAYAAVNCEFARYLRLKYPQVRYLNREDDMGLEGLRKAKLSYLPDHMVEKHWAYLKEELYAP